MSRSTATPAKGNNFLWDKVVTILQMVKFSHSIFALPIALMSALIASGGFPPTKKLILIILAMVGARNAGMAFNRVADIKYDSLNPRTNTRALPAGQLSLRQVWIFIITCSIIYFVAAYFLGNLAFILSPFILAVIFFYSYTKRITSYAHMFLGLALGLAPIGAWIAIKDSLSLTPVVLSLATIFWVSGFDIIYACQDAEFDKNTGLHSIPQRFGIERALWISAICHIVTIALLLWIKVLAGLGNFYLLGCVIAAILLIYEHYIVKPSDLSRVNQAFAMVNAMVSVVMFLATALNYLL